MTIVLFIAPPLFCVESNEPTWSSFGTSGDARDQRSPKTESPTSGEVLSDPLRKALEISQGLKAQLAGAKIEGKAQVAQLLGATLDAIDELPSGKQWKESERSLVCKMIDDYNRRDAKVVSAVNTALGLAETSAGATVGEAALSKQPSRAESLTQLERIVQLPEQRGKLVADLLERGYLRDTLESVL